MQALLNNMELTSAGASVVQSFLLHPVSIMERRITAPR